MRRLRARNATRGAELGGRIGLADGPWTRMRGLLGRRSLADGEGLLLVPCRSIHMFGMRFALDVAFVAPDGRVVALYPELAPGGRSRWHRDARAALELPAGTLARSGTRLGDVIEWEG